MKNVQKTILILPFGHFLLRTQGIFNLWSFWTDLVLFLLVYNIPNPFCWCWQVYFLFCISQSDNLIEVFFVSMIWLYLRVLHSFMLWVRRISPAAGRPDALTLQPPSGVWSSPLSICCHGFYCPEWWAWIWDKRWEPCLKMLHLILLLLSLPPPEYSRRKEQNRHPEGFLEKGYF